MQRSFGAWVRRNAVCVGILTCLVLLIIFGHGMLPVPQEEPGTAPETVRPGREFTQLRGEKTSLQKQIAVQEETITDLRKQNKDLNNENTNLQGDLKHCKDKFSHLRQEQQSQEQRLSGLADNLEEKQREVNQLNQQNSNLNRQLDEGPARREHENNSVLTNFVCVYGYCLGFGSCHDCS